MALVNLSPNMKLGAAMLAAALTFGPALRAADAAKTAPAWPEAAPAQLKEDIFGIRLQLVREMDGDRAAKELVFKALAKDPQPHVKAYAAWYCFFGAMWGAPEMEDPGKGLELAEQAIAAGSSVAREVLGRALLNEVGDMRDPRRAVQLIREAADLGDTRAQARLATLMARGWRMPSRPAEAARIARRAAELGQPIGLLEIGMAYERGAITGGPDRETAARYYFEAAWHSDKTAWAKLVAMAKDGVAGADLYCSASLLRMVNAEAEIATESIIRQYVEKLAGDGSDNPWALVELARARVNGKYLKRDFNAARMLLEKAVAAGHDPARFFLAQMRLRGQGGPKEPAAIEQIRTLAAQGNAEACSYLGWLHYWGGKEAPGIKKDARLAFEYCRQAAERGSESGLMNLGFCYEYGIGTPENYALAAKAFWQANLRHIGGARVEVRRLLPHVKL